MWSVILHQDWKYDSNKWDADISLVVLVTDVDLSDELKVGTVCLPQQSQLEVSGSGIVVGWGISEKSEARRDPHDSVPNKLKLPAVTKSECLESDDDFEIALSPRAFCAGFLNQMKSACKGDSGGGWFTYNNSTEKYDLGGIVSASLNDPYGRCRSETYSIFTDVTKFTDWIEEKIEETKEIKWKYIDFVQCTFKIWDVTVLG